MIGSDRVLLNAMPTEQQRKTLDILVQKRAKKEPIVMGKVLQQAGYSVGASRYPGKVINSTGFKQLLASIDNTPLLEKLNEIALGTDKRSSIAAIKEIFTLKDLYPANKLKVSQYQEELNQF